MEAGGAEAGPHHAILPEVGFKRTIPTGLHAGSVPWVRGLADGACAYLTVDASVTLTVAATDGTHRETVAGIPVSGGGNPPWGGIPAGVGVIGALAALQAWLAAAPAWWPTGAPLPLSVVEGNVIPSRQGE